MKEGISSPAVFCNSFSLVQVHLHFETLFRGDFRQITPDFKGHFIRKPMQRHPYGTTPRKTFLKHIYIYLRNVFVTLTEVVNSTVHIACQCAAAFLQFRQSHTSQPTTTLIPIDSGVRQPPTHFFPDYMNFPQPRPQGRPRRTVACSRSPRKRVKRKLFTRKKLSEIHLALILRRKHEPRYKLNKRKKQKRNGPGTEKSERNIK